MTIEHLLHLASLDTPNMTPDEARALMHHFKANGNRCPGCGRHAEVYRWTPYGSALRMLARLHAAGGTHTFVESKTVKDPGQGGDGSRLAHWRLAEQQGDKHSGRSGWWRVTPKGSAFLHGQATIHKYIYVYGPQAALL